jgi:hypothetical protein
MIFEIGHANATSPEREKRLALLDAAKKSRALMNEIGGSGSAVLRL